MYDFTETCKSVINSSSFRMNKLDPSEWAEKHRVMSSDVSSFPGKYSYDLTPYLREIVDHLSLKSNARIVAVMKGGQIGFSTGLIENGIGWIISESPAPILLTSGDKDLSKEMMEKRIDQMIDSCGLRNRIRPNAMRKRNQRTGDTSHSKEFAGGYLIADGVNNVNKLRQRSLMYGFIDDFEATKQTDKKAGNITSLIEQRFASYFSKMKLFYISTPEIKQTSNIEPVYLLGDQRKYCVPCPKCGGFIPLEWKTTIGKTKELAGITFKLSSSGKLLEKSVGYTCQLCGGFFNESNKFDMIQQGRWIPTKEPSEVGYYSYQINALYTPPGMYNWLHYVRQFMGAYPNGLSKAPDTEKLKTFLNVVLGQTYEMRGRTPKIKQLQKNTRNYEINTVPNELSNKDGNGDIVLLTCSCDLNGKVDDARIDFEVLAWSETGANYSINAGSIGTFQRGKSKSKEKREMFTYRNNEPMNVWDKFIHEVLQKDYISDDKRKYSIMIGGIDTGYFTTYAYNFINKMKDAVLPIITCGIKGESDKSRKIDADTPPFKKSKENKNLFVLEVNQLKDELAEKMQLIWSENTGYSQPPGFMNFPTPQDNKYTTKSFFEQFESEHKVEEKTSDGRVTGYKWVKRHSTVNNHFWDTRIYNMALRDIFVDEFMREAKIKYGGWSEFCKLMKA